MATKHDLKHSVLTILRHNKDGSFATQANRRTQLLKLAEDLLAKGFYIRNIHQLKAKHIYRMLDHWKAGGISVGTIKNRMANVRWLAEKINKPGIIPISNDQLKIERRQYITNKDKSIELTAEKIEKITDENVKLSLQLQQAFGLRKEESIKIKIYEAVQESLLKLRGAWCKSGREREVPIRTAEQWQVVEACKAHVGNINRALIPIDKSYYQHMKRYENQIAAAGINKAHGLRHAYAQQRYFELAGWHCPAKGGPTKNNLTSGQKKLDQQAREIISKELGHDRVIASVYCGR